MEITEAFLAKIAGWEAMKHARSLLERDQVLSSNWTPPILKGVVQEGSISYRAGLVLNDSIDIENMCSCRASRQWGTICAHSVAVGLHHLRRDQPGAPVRDSKDQRRATASGPLGAVSQKPSRRLQRAPEGGGVSLALSVIFPPNFLQALGKGKVMVCFEGERPEGRSPLNALPMSVPFRLTPPDALLLDTVEELAEGQTPAMLMCGGKELERLLLSLRGHPRVTLGRKQELSIASTPSRFRVRATLEESGEILLAPADPVAAVVVGESAWRMDDGSLKQVGLPKGYQELLSGPMKLSRARVPQFLSNDWPAFGRLCELEANFQLDDFELAPAAPQFLLSLSGGMAQLHAQLQCVYGQRIMTVGVSSKDESLWLPDPQSATRYSTRDWAAEQAALGRLQRHGFRGPDVRGQYQLLGQEPVLNFFAREYPRLEREWKVTLEPRLERSTSQNIERIEPKFEITPSGEQWFDLSVSYTSSGGERFSAADVQRLLLSGQSHTRLKSGRIAVIDTGAVEELQEVLVDTSPQQHANGYRMSNSQAAYLESTLRAHEEWQVKAPAEWRERSAQQSGAVSFESPDLGELDGVLRPYQKHGVAWMRFLRENRFGGILADEMGLGKTLQALAFIQAVVVRGEHEGETATGKVLVVCPTSLVFNWVEEARKFTPRLRVLALHGPERHRRFDQIAGADVVVTSYGLIRRDSERYRDVEFDMVVLDEAQHIKNRQTQNAQAVKAIRSEHKLVLTGTPLENSVLDLWSIFDFLMPGYLGSAKDFRERYEIPITREKDRETELRLARRVRPFLLRRMKRDVAKDLPEKIEQVSFCELTEEQQSLYQQVLEAGRREVVESVNKQGVAKSRMVILTALLRLRQICCDLRLLKLDDAGTSGTSGKLDMFEELLQEVIDGGHRVLVFSQFVGMLKLIREKLSENEIDCCYLDGSTVNRAEVVERFQKSNSIPVFLISLKAGGVGLNLAAADTVIHFDPWWNPAVEAQATDRAHRIGQTRVVTSYKLIARGTVEEKILNLQQRKRAVTEGVLHGDEELAQSLSWDEIQELFQ